MDKLTQEQRHKAMSHIKSEDTSIEKLLRKELWLRGIRYRKNWKALPGKPDIAITKYKIAVFCDSDFFHGRDWPNLETRLTNGANPEYWIKKITRNMERDKAVDKGLLEMGWRVIRFWGNEIKADPRKCASEIEEAIIAAIIEKQPQTSIPSDIDSDYFER